MAKKPEPQKDVEAVEGDQLPLTAAERITLVRPVASSPSWTARRRCEASSSRFPIVIIL